MIRAANRANATFYPIDPRGLVAGPPDPLVQVNPQDWNEHVRRSQDSLRQLAEGTGGIAVVNRNGLAEALKQIDADTADYYLLAYYSNNPDPLRRTRKLEVRVTRPGVEVKHRPSYTYRQVPP